LVVATVIGNGGAAKILFFQFLRNLLHCQGIRRSQEENESKRGKKARDIGKNKQPKCQNIVRLVRFIGDGMGIRMAIGMGMEMGILGGFRLGPSVKVNKAKSGNASEIIPQKLGSSN